MSKGTCSVPGCGSAGQLRRGMCSMHYERVKKYGSTEKPLPTCPKGHRVEVGHCAECAQARAANREICIIDGCQETVLARGWCSLHYQQWWKRADPALFEKTPKRREQCSINACERDAVTRGWCGMHYSRWLKTGTTDDPPERPSECSIDGCGDPVRGFGWCKNHWRTLTGKGTEERLRRLALQRGSQVGPVDHAAILAEFGMVCHICDSEIDSIADLHFDHVIPLSRGGPHAQENIRPSHKKCNLRKGTRLMSELAAGGR